MATYNENEKSYASSGVGTAGLTLGVIGTALASGILNGGLGGILGNNQNPASSPVYQLAQKDNEIALLKAQQYSDAKTFSLAEKVANLEARVLADEKTDPLRDQILGDRIAGLQGIVNRISAPFVPNYALAPGYGPAMVAPLPPPQFPVQSTTPTPAASGSSSNG
jgi:hypothetical protein